MHILGTTAIIINNGKILLTRRNDLPVWVAPGGHLDQGETVQDGCLREVREETGLDVEIERLIGLYARQRGPGNSRRTTSFVFACRVVGGTPQVSDETTDIRYWPVQKLPVTVPAWHRRYLSDALDGNQKALWHSSLTPLWATIVAWPALCLRWWVNRLKGRPRFTVTRWGLGAFVTLFDDAGRVLLARRRDYPVWNLPGGKVERGEAPWEAAVRETREETGLEIEIERLTAIYSKPSRAEIVLGFQGRVTGGRLVPTEESEESRYFPVDALPEPILPKHVEHIHDSAARYADVVLKVQDTPPGLEILGFK